MASRTPLPSLKRSRTAPYLAVEPLSEKAAGVRRWFSKDARHFAEAYGSAPCGCGFPEVSEDRAGRPVPQEHEEAVKRLATYLEERPGRKYIAELLLCWVGDEDDSPPHRREIGLEVLRARGFRFRRGEVLRVRAGERGA
jgi:hypothetical protein